MSDPEGVGEDVLVERFAAAAGGEIEPLLDRHRDLLHPGIVERLVAVAREKLRVSPHESLRIAETALAIALRIGDAESRARGLRAKANAFWMLNQNRAAVAHFDQALEIFRQLGDETEIGRTLSTSIQALIRLGEYTRASEGAAHAREIFTRAGDTLRLARLELNAANIDHRQDRFAEALERYEQAYRQLVPLRDAEAIAVALHNMAVCLISLNDFRRALATHESVRAFSRQNGMPAIAVQADYNISYLYYLRGEYSRALAGLRQASADARAAGDEYHCALCAMDSAEIYLELNMHEEAAESAQEAYAQFQRLGMNYEAAKSLVNLAIATGQPRNAERSLELFSRARSLFVQEQNAVWPSLIDLYQAFLLYDAGRLDEARPLCLAASAFFRESKFAAKEILCKLLLARLALRAGGLPDARSHCASALAQLETVEAPHLLYRAHLLLGEIQEASGLFEEAFRSYQAASSDMESLRNILRGEELKIAFMKNKQEVYERLVQLCVNGVPGPCRAETIFDYMEHAKSRSLRDLFLDPPRRLRAESPLPAGIDELRAELNWYYHRIEREELTHESGAEQNLARLRDELHVREKNLARLMRDRELSSKPSNALHHAQTQGLQAIRAALPAGATLVEYFRARDRILAAVLSAAGLDIVPVAPAAAIGPIVRLLRFQFSRFNTSTFHAAREASSFRATQGHLSELYKLLVAPLRHHLHGDHLIFVPHEELHHIPFHALHDGARYLCDSFAISYAPSATVFALCHAQQDNSSGGSLILAVPDSQAPFIETEARAVAEVLPHAQLFVGPQANRTVLAAKGESCRYIHIATHGRFRGDNPMFSAIRLGDAYLTLYDLYQFRLPAELITLSGCSTGLSVVAKGDELLGLVRGLLHAGARSLLLSLWDVQDRTSADLMQVFYARLASARTMAEALQGAMCQVREARPHPYYWAPFFLTGSAS